MYRYVILLDDAGSGSDDELCRVCQTVIKSYFVKLLDITEFDYVKELKNFRTSDDCSTVHSKEAH